MFELFYDLVFVYAISKITAMVHHPVNGGIPLTNLLQFLFAVIVVMQIWLYQALYFNRYSQIYCLFRLSHCNRSGYFDDDSRYHIFEFNKGKSYFCSMAHSGINWAILLC